MVGAVMYHIIELANYYLTYKVLLNIKFTGKKMPYLWVVGMSCIAQILVYSQMGFVWGCVINTSLLSGFIGAMILAISKKRIVILLYPIAFFICSFMNTVGSCVVAVMTGKSQYEVSLSVPLTCLSECTAIGVLLIYNRFRKQKKRDEIHFSVSQYILLYIGIVCLMVLLAFSQELFASRKEYWERIKELAMLAIVLLATCFGVLSISLQRTWRKSFQYKAEKEKYELFLTQQESHIRMLIVEDEKRRKLRHDMNAHMLALDTMIEKEDWTELRRYFEQMKKSLGERNVENYTKISAVDAVIGELHHKAMEKQIAWLWEGDMVWKEQITVFELCTLFSNLLSNAIEAADAVDGEKEIRIKNTNFQNQLVISVGNTCSEKLVTNTRPASAKQDEVFHGLGLRNVEEIVEKHHGDIQYSAADGWFQVDIIL